MGVRILLRDTEGNLVGRDTREADDLATIHKDGKVYRRVGVEDKEIIFVEIPTLPLFGKTPGVDK
jgi:hypothetical protein